MRIVLPIAFVSALLAAPVARADNGVPSVDAPDAKAVRAAAPASVDVAPPLMLEAGMPRAILVAAPPPPPPPPPYPPPPPSYQGPAPYPAPYYADAYAGDPCCNPCLRWDITVGAWAWAIDGDVGSRGRHIDVDSDLTDTFDEGEVAFMGRVQASWNKWWAALEVEGANLDKSATFEDGPIEVDGTLSIWIAQAEIGYKFWGDRLGCDPCAPVACAGPYVGARFVSVGLEADAIASTAPVPGIDRTKEWVDPIIGFRATLEGPRWLAGISGDVGGFGVGSDFTWSVTAWGGFRFTSHIALVAGWKVIDEDYDNDGFVFDATLSGPFLALTFTF